MLGIIALIFAVIAQVLPSELIILLAPLVVFAVTYLIKWLIPKIPGWTIVSIIVPLFSVIAAWVAQMINPELSFWLQVGLGLISVFVAEIIKQLSQVLTAKK